MSSKESEINRKVLEYEYYKQLLDNYQNEFTAITALLNEVDTTLSTINELYKLKSEQTEIYASLGSGSYLKVNLTKENKILLNVGAKIFIEYTLEQATDFLNRRKQKITESLENTSKIIRELSLIVSRLESEIAKLTETKR
ncbi:MAG: prefoldin subunit alpha [Thermoproteota archaeon]|jgi:prefoldin, archaeal alpha subunit/eukaryotic subunit 5